MVQFSQFECLLSPAAAKFAKELVMSTKVNRKDKPITMYVPTLVTFLVPLLLLTTTWFSSDHKRNVSDGVVSGIGTLFSLDHKLYASDFDLASPANILRGASLVSAPRTRDEPPRRSARQANYHSDSVPSVPC